MWRYLLLQFYVSWMIIGKCISISSPIRSFMSYQHSIELQTNVADLHWTVDDDKREIIFELHVKSTGWIALGISPAGGMKGADIAVGWVDSSGNVYLQDRYAFDRARPIIDNTTQDWFALQGREQDGWTAIQFKRFFDSCDHMDYPITSGTNTLIFAYGLEDLNSNKPDDDDISYHTQDRRGSRIIPLRSYSNPPPEDKFIDLDTFELRLNNYLVPPNDTTYHCKVFKAPNGYPTKRHAIAHKTLVDPANIDLVHHLLLYECDPMTIFEDDNNLPDDVCDAIFEKLTMCSANIATAWAVGGDYVVEFPEEAGFPVGGDFPIKYYLIEMHYDNPKLSSIRRDSSGIRFYLGNELRKHDLGYLTVGTGSNAMSIAIPPKVNQFVIDSFCPSNATMKIPESGITVFSAFPHTHLQGIKVWTKLIRNDTAVQYLFNAEKYDFNYQFDNRLPHPIQLYPGDAFATRCVYNTENKNDITLGGSRTKDEMCLHIFTYYPRMNDIYGCMTTNNPSVFESLTNDSVSTDYQVLKQWLSGLKWTPELATQWQQFFNNASRILITGRSGQFEYDTLAAIPTYKDLQPEPCQKQGISKTTNGLSSKSTSTFISLFMFISCLILLHI